ncbi:hypothetical protein [Cetobacterium somerae]
MKNKVLIIIAILGIVLGTIYNIWRFNLISQELNISFMKAMFMFMR